VLDKEKANFCDEFEFAEDKGPQKETDAQARSRDVWGKLFGNK
jgi:hypothetical protein